MIRFLATALPLLFWSRASIEDEILILRHRLNLFRRANAATTRLS